MALLGNETAPEACVQKVTPISRLENALSRLDMATGNSVDIAHRLTGGWAAEVKNAASEKPKSGGGVFGAVEEMADAIHRICDRLDEANSAVMARLP